MKIEVGSYNHYKHRSKKNYRHAKVIKAQYLKTYLSKQRTALNMPILWTVDHMLE